MRRSTCACRPDVERTGALTKPASRDGSAVATAGTLSLQVPIPPIIGFPCTTVLSVQAVMIDPCGLGVFAMPGPFVLSQSYSLLF